MTRRAKLKTRFNYHHEPKVEPKTKTNTEKMQLSSTYGKAGEPMRDPLMAEIAKARGNPPEPTPSAAMNNLLTDLEAQDEVIASLRKELEEANRTIDAVKNYRLQAIATPILAAIVGAGWNDTQEAGQTSHSAAAIAILHAQALIAELDGTENPDE